MLPDHDQSTIRLFSEPADGFAAGWLEDEEAEALPEVEAADVLLDAETADALPEAGALDADDELALLAHPESASKAPAASVPAIPMNVLLPISLRFTQTTSSMSL